MLVSTVLNPMAICNFGFDSICFYSTELNPMAICNFGFDSICFYEDVDAKQKWI